MSKDCPASRPEMHKRLEIFLEFLWWFFDTLLVTIIRSNFYVTQTNLHQNELFYFRHDVWRALSQPAFSILKLKNLERIDAQQAKQILDSRQLGYSQIRLLPKSGGLRCISNLSRKMVKAHDGRKALMSSINDVLTPILHILDLQRMRRPDLMGSGLSSTGDMRSKLKEFGSRLKTGGKSGPLYFAKVDVKSCYDSLPQRETLDLIKKIISQDDYELKRHCEIRHANSAGGWIQGMQPSSVVSGRPNRKFRTLAQPKFGFRNLTERIGGASISEKTNTVFVDGDVRQPQDSAEILDLLTEHIEQNVIKIGHQYYRQKIGIPQGSKLSSSICNFFYADLERQYLGFLDQSDSLLLRLIDDFLLITANREHAARFLEIMHAGIPSHGVEVNPDKSLVNFDVQVRGRKIAQQDSAQAFAYCGSTVDMRTLSLMKDRQRGKDRGIYHCKGL